MRTHFIEVRDERGLSGSPHPRLQYNLAAAVLAAVHGENVRLRAVDNGPGIAVAFPGLIDDEPHAMGVIRAFGTSAEIRGLARRLRTTVGMMEKVAVDEVEEVGERRPRRAAAFCRDRRPEKEVVGYHDRALRRAQRKATARSAAGEEILKLPMPSHEREEARITVLSENPGYVRRNVAMTSSSTRSGFSLWVIPVSSNGDQEGEVDTYGLSRVSSTVPLPHF